MNAHTPPPEAEQGDLPEHAVPPDLVELHQLQELNGAGDGEG